MATIPAALDRYLATLVETLGAIAELDAVYLVGSAAYGAFEVGRSDVDVVAVTASALSLDQKQRLVTTVEALPVPARALELVVYSRDEAASPEPRWQINLNTGDHVTFDDADESPHWFVIDRSIAERYALPLLGPRWADVFAPVTRAQVLDAIEQSLRWQEEHEPIGRSSVLNTVRSWHWLETGEWVSKYEAAAALRARVREALP